MVRAEPTELTPASRRIRRTATIVFFGVVPAAWLVIACIVWFGSERAGFDLRLAYLPAAHDVLNGDSPYPLPGDPEIASQHAYVYSPLVAFAVAPLTVFSTATAVKIGIVASFAAALAVLWLVGVRDWRCYGVAVFWPPVINSAGNAAVSVFLAVLLAAAWRWRNHEIASGALVGVTVAAKSFAWPLLAWPVVLRRWRGAVTGVLAALVVTFGTWAVIGFAGLSTYPDLLRELTDLEERNSFSLSGALLELGAGTVAARGVAVALTIGLIGLAAVMGRRGDERRAFVALLLASLVATPILWQHYLVFLLLAVAITWQRLSVSWFVPFLFYIAPWTGNGRMWQTVLVPAIVTLVALTCLVTPPRWLGRRRIEPARHPVVVSDP